MTRKYIPAFRFHRIISYEASFSELRGHKPLNIYPVFWTNLMTMEWKSTEWHQENLYLNLSFCIMSHFPWPRYLISVTSAASFVKMEMMHKSSFDESRERECRKQYLSVSSGNHSITTGICGARVMH